MIDDKVVEQLDEVLNKSVDKLLGLKTYKVLASETVYYLKYVKATDEDDAWDKAKYQTDYLHEDIVDGDYFSIVEVSLDEEA